MNPFFYKEESYFKCPRTCKGNHYRPSPLEAALPLALLTGEALLSLGNTSYLSSKSLPFVPRDSWRLWEKQITLGGAWDDSGNWQGTCGWGG